MIKTNKFLYLLLFTLPFYFSFNSAFHLNQHSYQTNKHNVQISTGLKFINNYVKKSVAENIEIEKYITSSKLVSKDFKTNFRNLMNDAYKNDPEMGLGFDPIFDAQDFPEKGFELDSFDPVTGFMIVKGIDWSDFKVTMKIISINGKWFVDGCGVINIPDNKRSPR